VYGIVNNDEVVHMAAFADLGAWASAHSKAHKKNPASIIFTSMT
jgi:hypothetical protein